MKRAKAIVYATVGAMLCSGVAMAIPIPHGQTPSATADPTTETSGAKSSSTSTSAHLTAGRTLLMDARLGHATIPRSSSATETYLFASITGADIASTTTATGAVVPTKASPLDLAIVVDRSGSMKGERIANALAAAVGAVDRMREGDSVVVVTFDTTAQVVVPRTSISATTRPSIEAAIRSIRLGGDTCISCGLEEARRELDRSIGGVTGAAGVRGDRVTRMMLLSDGVTNNGIRDIPGLRALASRMRDRGCAITTIGVDVEFDERVMGALATESNGNHYFVANAAGLPSVFNQEFDTLVATIAREAEIVVEPAAGVEIQEVFDRPFHRDGSRVVVPFGSFSAKDEKSLLVKMRVPSDRDGEAPIANIKLVYRDLSDSTDATFSGALSVHVSGDGSAQTELDPFVRARIERSTTARALAEANELVNQGRFVEARSRLAGRSADLGNAQAAARHAAPTPTPARARGFKKDLDDQSAAIDNATKAANAAASATPSSRATKVAPKEIQKELSNPSFF